MNKLVFHDQFSQRHMGPQAAERDAMCRTIGVNTPEQLVDQTVPANIRLKKKLNLPEPMTEHEYLRHLRGVADKNKVFRTYIGQGYYGTITPAAIARNIFHNPGWYTQYTPYQAEIAQGRLESLLNFQTMVSDLTALPIANASLLDEATAAAEAMALFYGIKNKSDASHPHKVFLVDEGVFPHTIDVLRTRALPIGIEVKVQPWTSFRFTEEVFGVLVQCPNAQGALEDFKAMAEKARAAEVYVTVAADILSLALVTPPGEWGADCAVGSTQRFGIPIGFGGPHAAYFATRDEFKRLIPGRIIGMSVDVHGQPALRMALQTREQHIRREKATSNICTAQALLANMAAMYAVYHGPEGIRAIAERVHTATKTLANAVEKMGYTLVHKNFFDTLCISADKDTIKSVRKTAEKAGINFYYTTNRIQVNLDETVTASDLDDLFQVFAGAFDLELPKPSASGARIPARMVRKSEFLTHPVFQQYHTETELMRYIKRLENKDLSLNHSMISLGSCTMKLNAAVELMPVSWPEFADIHPFAPAAQTQGYQEMIRDLSNYLCEITGFDACSLQPNSGAQGEYTGLLTIRAYHEARNQSHRDVALIPSSAHGTNPASAVMAGMEVVVTGCDENGNIDVAELKAKADQYADRLACLMVTYPSTHGVFETTINEICDYIHAKGGLVYMDGANMNAQVGLTNPARIGADVCHLNLHKTFAIPHGGGGPGMGPICVNKKLAPYLPGHVVVTTGGEKATTAVSAAPFGSASILLISYAYIRMLGAAGVTEATTIAILNANYIKARLEPFYKVLYTGVNGNVAHELIVDLRPFKALGLEAEDIAKRLMDYGFHAPTLSFPVAGTIMIEPTESENQAELDRFCDALIAIRKEIDEISNGLADAKNNVLHNAPHTLAQITADEWPYPYSRSKAAWPLPWLQQGYKFWATVGRINQAYGDRNLVCTCPPVESYARESSMASTNGTH